MDKIGFDAVKGYLSIKKELCSLDISKIKSECELVPVAL